MGYYKKSENPKFFFFFFFFFLQMSECMSHVAKFLGSPMHSVGTDC